MTQFAGKVAISLIFAGFVACLAAPPGAVGAKRFAGLGRPVPPCAALWRPVPACAALWQPVATDYNGLGAPIEEFGGIEAEVCIATPGQKCGECNS